MSEAAVKLSKSKMELFRLNQSYYRQNKSELFKKYMNKFVAIWDERVIDFDSDKIKLVSRVYKNIGYLPIYIQKVTEETPSVRILSPKIKQKN